MLFGDYKTLVFLDNNLQLYQKCPFQESYFQELQTVCFRKVFFLEKNLQGYQNCTFEKKTLFNNYRLLFSEQRSSETRKLFIFYIAVSSVIKIVLFRKTLFENYIQENDLQRLQKSFFWTTLSSSNKTHFQ